MDSTRLTLAVLLLSGCFLRATHAQPDAVSAPAQQDDGAGYQIAMTTWDQTHDPARGDDPYGMGKVKLHLSYPVIAAPLTAPAKAYNRSITPLAQRWWKDIGGPQTNAQSADPGTDYYLACTGVGGQPEYAAPLEEQMLPGVISMDCTAAAQPHSSGTVSGGFQWGYNWLVAQRRAVRPEDIFVPNSDWLKALNTLLAADRKATGTAPWAGKLDAADRHHWVLGSDGLGFAYSDADFLGYGSPCEQCVDVIPWSKLARYLRKDGIVPQADWSSAGVIKFQL